MAVIQGIYGKSEPEYVGCVIDKYEHNGYDDSDFYAVCWDEEKGTVVHIEYDTTRCGGGGIAKIDATAEVLRKVFRHYYNEARTVFDSKVNIKQAKTVNLGDEVVVVRGKKVAKGTTGRVFWKGVVYNRFSYRDEERVGIEVAGEKIFVPAEYVEVVGWETRLIKGKDRKRRIRTAAVLEMPYHYRDIFAIGYCKGGNSRRNGELT